MAGQSIICMQPSECAEHALQLSDAEADIARNQQGVNNLLAQLKTAEAAGGTDNLSFCGRMRPLLAKASATLEAAQVGLPSWQDIAGPGCGCAADARHCACMCVNCIRTHNSMQDCEAQTCASAHLLAKT